MLDYIAGDNTVFEARALEQLSRDGQLVAFRHYGFWQCMDTLRDVRLLERLWTEGRGRGAPRREGLENFWGGQWHGRRFLVRPTSADHRPYRFQGKLAFALAHAAGGGSDWLFARPANGAEPVCLGSGGRGIVDLRGDLRISTVCGWRWPSMSRK